MTSRSDYHYLCGNCGAVTLADMWTHWDRDLDADDGSLILSTDDPSFSRCPICHYDHTDDDGDPGVWDGTADSLALERDGLIAEWPEHVVVWAEVLAEASVDA